MINLADLALSGGDHARFSRVSVSNGTKRRTATTGGPPRDSTVKRWTPLPSAFLAPLAFPADFGDFVPRIFSIIFLNHSRNTRRFIEAEDSVKKLLL